MIIEARKTNTGIGMIEIIIGVSVFVVGIVGIVSGLRFFLNTGFTSVHDVKAQLMVDEGYEAMRSIRDENFDDISDLVGGGAYHLTFSSGTWATTTTATMIDGVYARTVTVSQVRRDSNDDIVASGGTVDSDTVKVTVSVSWDDGTGTTTKSVTGYLTNIFKGVTSIREYNHAIDGKEKFIVYNDILTPKTFLLFSSESV